MYTAEIIRRQQMEAHWRLYEHQLKIVEAMKPIAKLWGEKMREEYPDLAPQPRPDDKGNLEYCAVCDGEGFRDDPKVPCWCCNGSGLRRY